MTTKRSTTPKQTTKRAFIVTNISTLWIARSLLVSVRIALLHETLLHHFISSSQLVLNKYWWGKWMDLMNEHFRVLGSLQATVMGSGPERGVLMQRRSEHRETCSSQHRQNFPGMPLQQAQGCLRTTWSPSFHLCHEWHRICFCRKHGLLPQGFLQTEDKWQDEFSFNHILFFYTYLFYCIWTDVLLTMQWAFNISCVCVCTFVCTHLCECGEHAHHDVHTCGGQRRTPLRVYPHLSPVWGRASCFFHCVWSMARELPGNILFLLSTFP